MSKGLSEIGRWDTRYNLGEEVLDQEHQKLFSIIRKIHELSQDEDEEKAKHACREGVKYFKAYTISHLEHEEEFMKSLNYYDFERHKRIHDDLRDTVLPELEAELEERDYDNRSVHHFLEICVSWLIMHIKTEDQSIIKGNIEKNLNMVGVIGKTGFEELVKKLFKEMYDLEISPISRYYTGWDYGKVFFHELIFGGDKKNRKRSIIFELEEGMILSTLNNGMGLTVEKIPPHIVANIREGLNNLGSRLMFYMGNEEYVARSGRMMQGSEVKEIFRHKKVLYSTLFKTQFGNFSCSIYER